METLKLRCSRHGFAVSSVGQSGGLALLWRKDVDVGLMSFSSNHVDVEVKLPWETTK